VMSLGGTWKTSLFGFNDVDSIQTTGNPAKTAPRHSPTITPIFVLRRRRCMRVLT
jgi:hypothetical protein